MTGYDIPLSVVQDTFYQIWADSPFGKHISPANATEWPDTCNAEEQINSNRLFLANRNETECVIEGPMDLCPTPEAAESGNLLTAFRNTWWPIESGNEHQHYGEQDQQPVCGREEELKNTSYSNGPVRKLDIKALFSHEGFINFFNANASILTSIWNQLKFNFSLLVSWFLNTLWSASQRVYNFLFSVILFFTTLFYLLVASDDRGSYIPFKWFLFIFPKV